MLDSNLKSQLNSYLERVTLPFEIVASVDATEASQEMLGLLNDIVCCHVSRTLRFVREHLAARGIQLAALAAGMHLTGGCSLLPGIEALAQNVFGIPAQLARLHGVLGMTPDAPENPQYACAIGLTKLTSPNV